MSDSSVLREFAPRTIYIKVATEMLQELGEWSEPVQVKIVSQSDDTFELVFKKVGPTR